MNHNANYPKITITGDIGSGKSVVGRHLSALTGFEMYSTGTVQREIASRLKMNTFELNRYSESHPEIDQELDSFSKRWSHSKRSVIVDSRLGWFFIPESFKIYLKVNVYMSANRIMLDKSRKEETYPDLNSAVSFIKQRRQSEHERFKALHNIDINSINNYDLVIDTSYSTVQDICNLIVSCFNEWIKKSTPHRCWFPPKILYPTQKISILGRQPAIDLEHCIRKYGFYGQCAVAVIEHKGLFYICDGHQRVSAALHNNVSLVPVTIIASGQEELIPGLTGELFATTNCNLGWIYDWESCHNFTFIEYPQCIQT